MSADSASMPRPVLITGAAGFIGAALALRLLERGERVVGIDNLNTYYDPALKRARLARVEAAASPGAWRFEPLALEDGPALMALFADEQPRVVVNLAAQAGVRYSLENPSAYIQSNLVGSGTFSRAAAITAWTIWSTPQAVRCMGAIAISPLMSGSR